MIKRLPIWLAFVWLCQVHIEPVLAAEDAVPNCSKLSIVGTKIPYDASPGTVVATILFRCGFKVTTIAPRYLIKVESGSRNIFAVDNDEIVIRSDADIDYWENPSYTIAIFAYP